MSEYSFQYQETRKFRLYRFLARWILGRKRCRAVQYVFNAQWEILELNKSPEIKWPTLIIKNKDLRGLESRLSAVISIHNSSDMAQVSLAGLAVLKDNRARQIVDIMCKLHHDFRNSYKKHEDDRFHIFTIVRDLVKANHRREEILFALHLMRNGSWYFLSFNTGFPYDSDSVAIMTSGQNRAGTERTIEPIAPIADWRISVNQNILNHDNFYSLMVERLAYLLPYWLAHPWDWTKRTIKTHTKKVGAGISAILLFIWESIVGGIVDGGKIILEKLLS